MKKTLFSDNWTVRCPAGSGTVDLPHDYSVLQPRRETNPGRASNGYFNGGRGSYVKYFKPSAAHTVLDIDGAYMRSEVSCNGGMLSVHDHGYTPNLVDLTGALWDDAASRIEIVTEDRMPSSRWYAGAGLYRDVFLWEGGFIRVEPRDWFFHTLYATEEAAFVCLTVTVTADRACTAELALSGDLSLRLPLNLPKGKTTRNLRMTIRKPRLWTPETPSLYHAVITLTAEGEVADVTDVTFGVRTISFDAEHGFLLNGKETKLRGGCIHHDHGGLGAVSLPDAEERKIRKLKEAGFNAVRSAHNPPSAALLDACDRLGMLLMDEAFDVWNRGKEPNDYHLWFGSERKQAIAEMVLRDRQHPCVISYSFGNETFETCGAPEAGALSREMAAEIRKYDATRPVTATTFHMSMNPPADAPDDYKAAWERHYSGKDWLERTEAFYEPLDICGYNYIHYRFGETHEKYPKRVVWGSESKALQIYDVWREVMKYPHVIGDFTWTAWDNMGEAGAGQGMWERDGVLDHIRLESWPWRNCWQGDFDMTGDPRPQSFYRRSVWSGTDAPLRIFTTHPTHRGERYTGTGWHWYDVHACWTFGKEWLHHGVPCEVYTAADEVEWILNGKTVAVTKPEKNIARLTIPYEEGTLTAVAYAGGAEVGRDTLETVGKAASVLVEAEKPSFAAGRGLGYFRVTVVDAAGRRVPFDKSALTACAEGGEIAAFFSGSPADTDDWSSGHACHAFDGRALVIVRAAAPGEVKVTVSGEGLSGGSDAAAAL